MGAYAGWKRAYWRTFLADIGLRVPVGARVLDAGCGPAGIFAALPHAAVTAVDPLLARYDELPAFERDDFPHVRWVAAPLESFVAAGEFDFVFCLNVINHVRDLAGVSRVLAEACRPGGTVVISVDAHRHRLLKPLFRAVPGDILHPHQLDIVGYRDAFADAGLTVRSERLYKRTAIFDYVVLVLTPKPRAS